LPRLPRRRGAVNTGAGTQPSGRGPIVPGQPPTTQLPARPGAAQPTPRDGVIGGKPVGERESIKPSMHRDMQEGIRLQAASEEAMAAAGYRVERGPMVRLDERLTKEEEIALGPKGLDPLGRVGPKKNPDDRIGGNLADMVAPMTPKLEGVRDALSDKIKDRQAYRLVLNLSRTSVTREQIEALLQRKPIEGLQELFIIEKNGAIFRAFPDPEQITPAPQAR